MESVCQCRAIECCVNVHIDPDGLARDTTMNGCGLARTRLGARAHRECNRQPVAPAARLKTLFLWRAALGGESGVDRDVDLNRLVCENRELLCSHVQTPAHPSFCIKYVIAWRKRS